MMECWVRCGDGSEVTLPTAVSWRFQYGTGTPCDSFLVRCLWQPGQEKGLSSAARFFAQWNGQRIFTGVVDEYCVLCGNTGLQLEITGRSMAALLLDNEALPVQYQRAAWVDVAAHHVTPYGIRSIGGEKLGVVTGFEVGTGVSQWSVVQDFVCYHGGVVPRFDRMGNLLVSAHEDGEPLELNEKTAALEWEYREQRHGVLSSVLVRRRSDWGIQTVEDSAFLAEGGCASRVLTVPNKTGTAAMRYSADYQLRASRKERVLLTVTMAGAFAAWPGDLVDVKRRDFGANGLYRVARSEVICGDDGVTTTLVLGLPDSLI